MRVCVVGAGAAGLCAAKHLLHGEDTHRYRGLDCQKGASEDQDGTPNIENSALADRGDVSDSQNDASVKRKGFLVTVFEQAGCVGGTWVYTEDATDPATGLPVHSSMYKSLRTNLPKEVMGFPDFPLEGRDPALSYLPAADVLRFLNLYADHFQLRPHIKFRHQVKRVEPEGNGWRVTVTDLQSKTDLSQYYDAIMICNGHYHTPRYPEIPGMQSFPGLQLHSHWYRVPAPLAGQTVVVVGAGPSGLDLALEVSAVARHVILSHHQEDISSKFPDNFQQKPDIARVEGSTVTFQDGSEIQADVLFYCTGYQYSFPFLPPECEVMVQDNCVRPLYKHLVNIHRPSMCFIGLPYYVCAFTMFDIQVQYFLKVLTGQLRLPPKSAMLEHTEAEVACLRSRGLRPQHLHMMGPRQAEYYDSLTSEAGLRPVPPVLTAIHNHSSQRFLQDLAGYRGDVYRILDQDTFQHGKTVREVASA